MFIFKPLIKTSIMKKLAVPALAFSIVLTACGGGMNEEQLAELNDFEAKLTEAVDEVAEEVEVTSGDDLYSSEDGRFKIMFQGEPKQEEQIVPTVAGNIEMVTFMYEKSITEVYMVAYSDYPSQMVEESSVDEILANSKQGSSGNMGITEFDEEAEIEIDGNPGLFYKGKTGSLHVEYKLYMVSNRLYQLAIIRDGSYSQPERSSEFFDSFQLIAEEAEEAAE